MRLISWNLNGRRAKAHAQVAALLACEPDVVALQEVTRSTLPILRVALIDGFVDDRTVVGPLKACSTCATMVA